MSSATFDKMRERELKLARARQYVDIPSLSKNMCDIVNSYMPNPEFIKDLGYIDWNRFVEINVNQNNRLIEKYLSLKLTPDDNITWLVFICTREEGIKDIAIMCDIINANYPNLNVLEYTGSAPSDEALAYLKTHTHMLQKYSTRRLTFT